MADIILDENKTIRRRCEFIEKKKRADGTYRMSKRTRYYVVKDKPIITTEIKNEIKAKKMLGVPAAKLSRDYKISLYLIDRITK